MARKKKPENETEEDSSLRQLFEYVSNIASRSEKTSWNRKMDNMVKLLVQHENVENKILEIMLKEGQPIRDQIDDLRKLMINECIHPYDHLVLHENHVLCKFCHRKINITNVK